MTNHPLTDDTCFGIGLKTKRQSPTTFDYMRSAADWQLEQFKEEVSAEIADLRRYPGWKQEADTLEFYFNKILKKLRPQEDN